MTQIPLNSSTNIPPKMATILLHLLCIIQGPQQIPHNSTILPLPNTHQLLHKRIKKAKWSRILYIEDPK